MPQPGLCIIADDYGLGEDHDRVMRSLLAAGAIDGVSVLVETCTPDSARRLAMAVTPGQRIGLHFNLTLAPPGAPARPSRAALLARTALRIGQPEARTALQAQWAAFHALFGRAPDHIDGHEHCHAFPGIRRIVIDHARRTGVAVRSMAPLTPPAGTKDLVIAGLGRALRRRARGAGVPTNDRFGGILPFDDAARALARLDADIAAGEHHAARTGESVWLMVHPGAAEDPAQVAGHPAGMRRAEADFLMERRTPPSNGITSRPAAPGF